MFVLLTITDANFSSQLIERAHSVWEARLCTALTGILSPYAPVYSKSAGLARVPLPHRTVRMGLLTVTAKPHKATGVAQLFRLKSLPTIRTVVMDVLAEELYRPAIPIQFRHITGQ